MEQMNKSYTSSSKHKRNVSRNRKLGLRKVYFEGLIIDNNLSIDTFKEEILKEINEFYSEEIKKYININMNTNKNEVNYNNELKKYEEKKYWQRRAFKVKNNLEESLNEYDLAQEEEKELFINSLESKYPFVNYSNEEELSAKKQIDELNRKKEVELGNLELKTKKYASKIALKNEKVVKTIEKIESGIKLLDQEIKNYNEYNSNLERNNLKELELKLEEVLNEEEKEKLEVKINTLKNKIKMLEDDKVQLAVNNLKMYFGGVKAVDDLSFHVNKGEVFGLIGPNGAGKTTVFNCITQFYKPTDGTILYRNKENNIVRLEDLRTHDIINEGVARSFQNIEMIWELNVLDNLLVSAHSLLTTNYFDHMFHTPKMRKEEDILRKKALTILNDLGIAEYAYRFPFQLAYGILKKIELARTLMTNPSMIILDEPAAGLNEVETVELGKLIKDISKKYDTTIFLVEHDMGLVMSVCDRILAISFGKKLAMGTPKEIRNDEKVKVAYLGEDE